jgi:hypothetical protein
LAVRENRQAILTDAIDDERERRCVDFVDLIVVEPAHAQVQRTFSQLDLRGLIVEIEEIEAGLRIQAQRRRTDFELGARIVVGPQFVAGNQRTVDLRLDPVVLSGRDETDCAADISQARDARWRIRLIAGLLVRCRLRDRAEREHAPAISSAKRNDLNMANAPLRHATGEKFGGRIKAGFD